MKNFKRILCLLFVLIFTLQLASCKKKAANSEEETTEAAQTKAAENTSYKENWYTAPSIEAQAIYPLPLADFNESTNHYDITYGNFYVIEKDGKFGLIDSDGKLVTKIEFDSIKTCSNPGHNKYYASIVESEYYTSFYSLSTSTGTKEWTDAHSCEGFNGYAYRWNESSSSVYCVSTGGEYTYTVQLTSSLPETMVVYDGTDLTDKYVLVNAGKIVSPANYTAAGVFTGGVAAVQSNGKWGYIDSNGKTVLPFEFDAAEGYNALNYDVSTPYECSEGYLTVNKGGKFGIYSADGDLVVPCQYAHLTTVHNGRAFASQDGKTWGILIVDEKLSNSFRQELTTSASAAQ